MPPFPRLFSLDLGKCSCWGGRLPCGRFRRTFAPLYANVFNLPRSSIREFMIIMIRSDHALGCTSSMKKEWNRVCELSRRDDDNENSVMLLVRDRAWRAGVQREVVSGNDSVGMIRTHSRRFAIPSLTRPISTLLQSITLFHYSSLLDRRMLFSRAKELFTSATGEFKASR